MIYYAFHAFHYCCCHTSLILRHESFIYAYAAIIFADALLRRRHYAFIIIITPLRRRREFTPFTPLRLPRQMASLFRHIITTVAADTCRWVIYDMPLSLVFIRDIVDTPLTYTAAIIDAAIDALRFRRWCRYDDIIRAHCHYCRAITPLFTTLDITPPYATFTITLMPLDYAIYHYWCHYAIIYAYDTLRHYLLSRCHYIIFINIFIDAGRHWLLCRHFRLRFSLLLLSLFTMPSLRAITLIDIYASACRHWHYYAGYYYADYYAIISLLFSLIAADIVDACLLATLMLYFLLTLFFVITNILLMLMPCRHYLLIMPRHLRLLLPLRHIAFRRCCYIYLPLRRCVISFTLDGHYVEVYAVYFAMPCRCRCQMPPLIDYADYFIFILRYYMLMLFLLITPFFLPPFSLFIFRFAIIIAVFLRRFDDYFSLFRQTLSFIITPIFSLLRALWHYASHHCHMPMFTPLRRHYWCHFHADFLSLRLFSPLWHYDYILLLFAISLRYYLPLLISFSRRRHHFIITPLRHIYD